MGDDKEEDKGRGAVGAEEQAAGPYGDLPDKPGHLATAEQCRLANGGVCWHLLQMAVRARQIAQRSQDDSVSSHTCLHSSSLPVWIFLFCVEDQGAPSEHIYTTAASLVP